jgi:hypothetical protein
VPRRDLDRPPTRCSTPSPRTSGRG